MLCCTTTTTPPASSEPFVHAPRPTKQNPIQVADFGLSRAMSDGQDAISTRSFGTLTFMPPEVLRDGLVSKAADVYSFGGWRARMLVLPGASML
jgi:serine/threonine protein kinase